MTSSLERAILELLDEVPERETFHQADMLFEGLPNLSPRKLQPLLPACRSVKVKRLFLWFAERHQPPWLNALDRSGIDLGRGKRMLVKGGSTLLVPRGSARQNDVSERIADNAMMTLAPDQPPLRRVALKAGKKDTVASIARRYKVAAAQVALWNQVGASASFKPGQIVVVYMARPATRAVALTRPASTKARTADNKALLPIKKLDKGIVTRSSTRE